MTLRKKGTVGRPDSLDKVDPAHRHLLTCNGTQRAEPLHIEVVPELEDMGFT
jgi:hypothetical protein